MATLKSKVSPENPQPQYTLDVMQRIAVLPLDYAGEQSALCVLFSWIGDYFAEHATSGENKFEFHITDSQGRVVNVNVSDRP